MSLAEIKESVAALTVEERLDLAAWIAYLNRAMDSSHQTDLEARMARMDAGQKFTQADVERVHAGLNAKGQ